MTPSLWFIAGVVFTLVGLFGLAVLAAVLCSRAAAMFPPDEEAPDVEVRMREGAGWQ
jgi:hypothetical protein